MPKLDSYLCPRYYEKDLLESVCQVQTVNPVTRMYHAKPSRLVQEDHGKGANQLVTP